MSTPRLRSTVRAGVGLTVGSLLVLSCLPAGFARADGGAAFTAGTAQVATVTNGASTAPWNTSQGDPASAGYANNLLLPTYTPGGSSTGTAANPSPNLAVYPGINSATAGASPYPNGVVGTAGPLDAYCGTGDNPTEAAGTAARQPAGTTLPLAPAYFPHVVRNGDGSLTGYFDYRPKEANEAITAAVSTDNGRTWTHQGEALEQNTGYCPTGDVNDDGQGHPQVLTIGGVTRLYTLQRSAGDNLGVGLTVHQITPTAGNPLAGVPATEKVGVDANAFATAAASVSLVASTISLTGTGTTGSPLKLFPGGFVDLTKTPVPTAASVITCTGVGTTSLTGCTSTVPTGFAIAAGDLIEQVVATVTTAATVPVGPNKTDGTGGLASLAVSFVNPQTGSIMNGLAPNRAYLNGVAIYCVGANANPTTALQGCTTAPGTAPVTAAVGDPVTSDPILPSTAQMTSGLVAPDGIVGVLPTYPGLPAGATAVLYTQKYAGYYVAGITTNTATATFGATLAFTSSPYAAMDLPATVSAGSPVTVSVGDITKASIVPVTCTGMSSTTTTTTLSGCTVPAANVGDQYGKTSMVGAPGAATVDNATLAQTGQGAGSTVPVSAKNVAKLFKNNQDYTVLRVAYTTDGLSFATAGLANGGVISGASNGAAVYSDLSNPAATASPANLNDSAALSSKELRFIGSGGSVLTNPDGSIGLFLSGSWAADGDSDAYNRIIYATSTDGQSWTVPTTLVNTDYTFADSIAQVTAEGQGKNNPLGIGAYYSGRAYGPSVVPNPDGTLTMVFAGYRLPKTFATVGSSLGTNSAAQYTPGAQDPVLYRNIMVQTLTPIAASLPPTSLPEAPQLLLLPLSGLAVGWFVLRRRRLNAQA